MKLGYRNYDSMTESLGKILKKKRETKQLSIQEVSEQTRIAKDIITKIEEDQLGKISSLFYARGFVKSYAQFLGAIEEKVVKEFLAGQEKKDTQKLRIEGLDKKEPVGTLFKRYKKEISLVLLIIFGVWFSIFSFLQIKKAVIGVSTKYKSYIAGKKAPEEKKAAETARPESRKEAPEPAPKEKAAAEMQGVSLEITAKYNTWIQVRGDGNLLFKGILKKGAADTWQAREKIDLEIGNAGGVSLKLNDKKLGSPGKRGEKKEIVVTEEGIIFYAQNL